MRSGPFPKETPFFECFSFTQTLDSSQPFFLFLQKLKFKIFQNKLKKKKKKKRNKKKKEKKRKKKRKKKPPLLNLDKDSNKIENENIQQQNRPIPSENFVYQCHGRHNLLLLNQRITFFSQK